MRKYYLRFNPVFIRGDDKTAQPWQIIEIDALGESRHLFFDHVDIKVPTWTEKSHQDQDWWNIACEGELVQEDRVARIV